MNILLCGDDLPVGKAVSRLLADLPYGVVRATAAECLGLPRSEWRARLASGQINLILNLHCLPFSTPARVLEEAYVQLPTRLAELATAGDCMYFHLSDSQVFAGRVGGGGYRETDEPDTRTPYGALRWSGEQAAVECPRHLVLRTGELFASEGVNVVTRLLTAWQKERSAAVSLRYQFSPTHCQDAARVIVAMLQQLDCGISPWGVYHYCATDVVSYHDFARLVKQVLESQSGWSHSMLMHEIAEGQSSLSWALDCGKIRDTFGIKQRAWRAGFTSCIREALARDNLDNAGEENHVSL
jgi:dTDP-4-dehydrorhamnose reductase